MLALTDCDIEALHELLTAMWPDAWCDDRHALESNAVEALVESALDVCVTVEFRSGCGVSVGVDTVEGGDEGVDAGGVASELGEVFERVHHAAAGISKGEHEALVGDEAFHAVMFAAGGVGRVGGEFEDAAEAAPGGEEDGEGGEEVAKCRCGVLVGT